MTLANGFNVAPAAVERNLKRLTNQIYKLLPSREEGLHWQLPLDTIIEELSGMNILMEEYQTILFSLLCKLKGLTILTDNKDFSLYRRTIFGCLGLMGELTSCLDITI